MFCRKCGKQRPDDSEFCFKCGVRVLSNSSGSAPAECKSIVLEKSTQTETKTAVILDKSNTPIIKDGARICPKCGNKLSAPWCVYCGEDFPRSNTESASNSSVEALQAKPTVNNTKGDRDSSVYSTLPPKITPRKCDECGELVYNNQRSCHNCGATNPSYSSRFDNSGNFSLLMSPQTDRSNSAAVSETRARLERLEGQQQRQHEEDYDYFKSVSNLVVWVIIIIMILIMLLSGNASCTGFDEISFTESGMLTYVWIIIGLAILRGIVLLIYKHSGR